LKVQPDLLVVPDVAGTPIVRFEEVQHAHLRTCTRRAAGAVLIVLQAEAFRCKAFMSEKADLRESAPISYLDALQREKE